MNTYEMERDYTTTYDRCSDHDAYGLRLFSSSD